jgi:hypothetical protein
MRDSFFHLKEWYMTTERPEDFEPVRDYVVEQTRMASIARRLGSFQFFVSQ